MKQEALYRVLDANLNRLREGVRVVEEIYRFVLEDETSAVTLKELRHELQSIEAVLGYEELLAARDSEGDMFAQGTLGKEIARADVTALFRANIRRAQEAARVLEEFLKLSKAAELSETAKKIRFELYTREKEWGSDGEEIR